MTRHAHSFGLTAGAFGLAILILATSSVSAKPGLIDSKDMGVSANAPPVCVIANQSSQRIRPLVNTTAAGSAAVQITALVDVGTMSTAAAQVEVSFDAMCNFPHRLNVASENNGLFRSANAAAPPSGFGSAVPYTADVRWGDQTLAFNANAKIRSRFEDRLLIGQPASGAIVLAFNVLPGATNAQNGAPLASGIYSDILTLTVEPQ